MNYITARIKLTEDDIYLEKKIYKFSSKLSLPAYSYSNTKCGLDLVFKFDEKLEFEFSKLYCKVEYWKSLRRFKQIAIINEIEALLDE